MPHDEAMDRKLRPIYEALDGGNAKVREDGDSRTGWKPCMHVRERRGADTRRWAYGLEMTGTPSRHCMLVTMH